LRLLIIPYVIFESLPQMVFPKTRPMGQSAMIESQNRTMRSSSRTAAGVICYAKILIFPVASHRES